MTTLVPNQEFSHPASQERVKRTAAALEANGMHTIVLESAQEARACVLEMIPPGTEVYNPPSRTLEQIGLADEIEHSTSFQALRSRVFAMDRKTQKREIRRLIASPDVIVGSVHAITEQGQVLIASASGSQLGAAVFGAGTVIWVVGTQKLVATLEEGFRRIREYSHPLEDERTRSAYGQPSAINKILVVNGEQPSRITIVLVKEEFGF
jgi:L-lactate utilization protein LutC